LRGANLMFDELRKLGVQLCIDDFGTGLSSLGQLNRFPGDMLKLGRSFVSNMHTDQRSMEMVRTVIALGNSLQMDVAAKGIETDEQLAFLRMIGCKYGQGFYISRPIAQGAFSELYNQDPKW